MNCENMIMTDMQTTAVSFCTVAARKSKYGLPVAETAMRTGGTPQKRNVRTMAVPLMSVRLHSDSREERDKRGDPHNSRKVNSRTAGLLGEMSDSVRNTVTSHRSSKTDHESDEIAPPRHVEFFYQRHPRNAYLQ